MGTTAQKLQAIADSKADIKTAIEGKGVSVNDIPLSQYAAKIATIISPDIDLKPDLRTIYNSYQDEGERLVLMFFADNDTTTFATETELTKIITSDGVSYTTFPATHTWDKSQDIDSGYFGYKTRWIIVIGISNPTAMQRFVQKYPCISYDIGDGRSALKLGNVISLKHLSAQVSDSQFFNSHRFMVHAPKVSMVGRDMNYMFKNCYRLISVELLNTEIVTNMGDAFSGCQSLQRVMPFNTGNAVDMSHMFQECSSLQTIPQLDMSKALYIDNMFEGCINLVWLPKLNTSQCVSTQWAFYGCYLLRHIEEIDLSSATNVNSTFGGCSSLIHIRFAGIILASLRMSDCKKLDVDSLMSAINALKDLTGVASQTLTLGTTNLAKLTDEQKAVATAKNWILN